MARQTFSRIIMLILIIAVLGIPSVYAQYPPPPQDKIVVHSTTIAYSGKPTTQFTFDVTQTDSQSVITEISLTTSVPLSSLRIHIFQLSDFPAGVTKATGVTLLIVQFVLPGGLDNNIGSATIDFKVPQTSVSSANVNPNLIIVQRYSQGSWSELSSKVIGSDSQFVYLEAGSPGLSVFAMTAAVPPAQFPWSLFISVVAVIAIVIAIGVFLVRGKRKTRA